MKKTIVWLFNLLLLIGLTACGNKPKIPETQVWNEEEQYFTFPGIEWGMTRNEWLSSWNLTEKDCEKSVADEITKVEGSEETVSYRVKEKLQVWEYPASVTVSFAKFPKEEEILVGIKATFSSEDEEAVVKRFQEEFHSDSAGYNNIINSPSKIADLDETLGKQVIALYESWGRSTQNLEVFGMSSFTWIWDKNTGNVTIDCGGIPAAITHLSEKKGADT